MFGIILNINIHIKALCEWHTSVHGFCRHWAHVWMGSRYIYTLNTHTKQRSVGQHTEECWGFTHLCPHSCREPQDGADGHDHQCELPSSEEPHYEACKKRGYCLKEHSNLVTNSFTDFGDVTKKDHTSVVTVRRSSVRRWSRHLINTQTRTPCPSNCKSCLESASWFFSHENTTQRKLRMSSCF